ncbi:MAG: hypothetical protein ACRECX_05185 [Methyloceanibacter sp.]|uniref:hypothetical protein n=1 Tax=Methyloceanibacter sp. TaxID=1965321 RepID=UPI003D6CF0B1
MGKRAVIALTVAMLCGAAEAEHAFVPETEAEVELVPAVTREVCTVSEWGYDEVRTDCRYEMLPPPRGNPALRGICTTYYGRRTCH